MRKTPAASRDDGGMTSAEYCVGTLGAVAVGGALLQLGQSEWFGDVLRDVLVRALDPGLFVELVREGRPFRGLRW